MLHYFKQPKRAHLNVVLFATICFLLVVFSQSALADDWPMLFHDPGRTCASADREVKPPFRILWRYAVEDAFGGHGNHGHKPIVADGVVYVSGGFHENNKEKKKDLLIALDALKGTLIWEKEGSFSTPAVSKGTLYTVQGESCIAFGAKTGQPKWSVNISPGGYIVVQKEQVYIAGGSHIIVLNSETGKHLWEWSYEGDIPKGYGSSGITIPAIDENGVYFVDSKRSVSCLDPMTGKVRWKKENFIHPAITVPTSCATAVANGILIIRTGGWIAGDPTARQGYKIYALSTKDGSILWQRGVLCGGKPVILAGDVFYTFGSFGEMLALDARTGDYIWDRSQIAGNGRTCGILLYANGALYLYTGHGGGLRRTALLCLDAGSGKMLWSSCDRGGLGVSEEWFWEAGCSGPSFANGNVYLATWWGGILALAPDKTQVK